MRRTPGPGTPTPTSYGPSRSGSSVPPGTTPATSGVCRRGRATSRPSPAGSRSSSPATATGRCAPSSTSAGTAARRSPPERAGASRCSARTTPGRTTSTARCARARGARVRPRRPVACSARLETWGPFLFVNADAAARPLADVLGPHARRRSVDARLPGADRVCAGRELEDRRRELPGVLPLPRRAPRVRRLVDVDPGSWVLAGEGPVWSQHGRAREDDGGCEFHLVWPALKVNVYPGLANLSIGRCGRSRPSEQSASSTTSSAPTSTPLPAS